ncbi:unnamed protein product [Rotaria sordida]|uniref:Uncharacterized protein n=1 Tax=Rotaria sordida TaxID=392033 RepID=A0A815CBZ4_9BILA|nr:unnamed protein product [Rotaria sordida]
MISNNIDLCSDNKRRSVKYKDEVILVDKYRCLFFASSTRLGTSIIEIMEINALRKCESIVNLSSKTE